MRYEILIVDIKGVRLLEELFKRDNWLCTASMVLEAIAKIETISPHII